MGHATSEFASKLVKALGPVPVKTNQFADALDGHSVHLGTLTKSFDSTDAGAASKAADIDVPGGKGSSSPDAPNDLTHDEREALLDYTGGAHRLLNSGLRSGGPLWPSSLNDLDANLSHALDKLPDYDGRSYRGTNLRQEVLDSMQPGGTHTDPGYLSSSTDINMAESFRDRGDSNALITIDGKTGTDIEPFSSNRGESEILFTGGTTFEVVSKTQNPHGVWEIHLREL